MAHAYLHPIALLSARIARPRGAVAALIKHYFGRVRTMDVRSEVSFDC